jgi:hypothetical protein
MMDVAIITKEVERMMAIITRGQVGRMQYILSTGYTNQVGKTTALMVTTLAHGGYRDDPNLRHPRADELHTLLIDDSETV